MVILEVAAKFYDDRDILGTRSLAWYRPRVVTSDTYLPGSSAGIPLQRTSPVPLYFQIAEGLRARIETGALRAGDQLDNEVELSRALGVSRPTVRQAIQRLVDQGLVIRRRGVGTVVLGHRIRRPLAMTSLYDDLTVAGRCPATTVLAVKTVPAGATVGAALSIDVQSLALYVERLRSVDGAPLAVLRNWFPPDLLEAGTLTRELSSDGLYSLFRKNEIIVCSADQTITARKATAREARLLRAAAGSTLLTMVRTAYDTTARPVEYGSHVYLASEYSFEMRLPVPGGG